VGAATGTSVLRKAPLAAEFPGVPVDGAAMTPVHIVSLLVIDLDCLRKLPCSWAHDEGTGVRTGE
jgi:hypothetical protein